MSVQNLLSVYSLAQGSDLDEAQWYYVAHEECKQVASELGIKFKNFVWAVAALSPMCYWERNILGVKQLALTGQTGHGFGKNRVKALECLQGNLAALKGDKVTRFALNLLSPADHDNDVVVDIWAIRAHNGVVAGEVNGLRGLAYKRVADDYRAAAETVGLKPSQFQAVVWVIIRRLGKVYNMAKRAQAQRRKNALKSGQNINAHQVQADILGSGKPAGTAQHLQGTNLQGVKVKKSK